MAALLLSVHTVEIPYTKYITYHSQIAQSDAKLVWGLAWNHTIWVHRYHPNTINLIHSYKVYI